MQDSQPESWTNTNLNLALCVGESTANRWILLTKGSNVDHWSRVGFLLGNVSYVELVGQN